jgi:hypothetical protein
VKSYLYRIKNGAQTVATWTPAPDAEPPLISDPSFSMEVDGSLGPLNLTLAADFEYDSTALANGRTVETYCIDNDTQDGVLVHAGTIERIDRNIIPTGDQVSLTIEPFVTQLARDYFRDDAAGTVIAKTWTDTEVATILRYIVGKLVLRGQAFSRVFSSQASVQTSGKTVSIQVGSETYLDAIRRVKKLGPGDFYWFVDASGLFTYRNFDSGTRHIFTLGKDLAEITHGDDASEIRNAVYFWNQSDTDLGGIAFERTDAASVALYGRRAQIITDSRIDSEATAEAAVAAFLREHATPTIAIEADVLDSTDNPFGYDIERIRPGDTCEIRNAPTLSATVFSIVRVDYAPDRAHLVLSDGPVRRPRTLGMDIEEMAEFMRTSTNGSIISSTTA